MEVLIIVVTALLLAVGGLSAALITSRREIARLRGIARKYDQLETLNRQLDIENRLFGKLIQDYLGFLREVYRQQSLRRIPSLLLKFMVWLFEPQEAVVMIRRKPAVADSNRESQLIVAASKGSIVRSGTVIPLSGDPLSNVAATGVPIEHADRKSETALPGFYPDLAVPMAIDEDVLGVLALMEPRQERPFGRQLLHLFAQSAALAHAHAVTLNRIRSEADLDPLTGVLNRGALMTLAEKFSEDLDSHGNLLSLFLFDIDHFKNYNDSHGHLPGDDCLRLLARIVADQTRSDDAFGRYGGEEFLLLLPGRGIEEALFVAEKLRSSIETYPFPYGEEQPLGAITVSGGVAGFPDHGATVEEVLAQADKALYAAKEAGRNRVFASRSFETKTQPDPSGLPPLPSEADDLQKIKGIGAKYAEALEGLGIFAYRQIAELNWRSIVRLAEQLKSSPERILREEWLRQARTLHREKYGSDVEESQE